MMQYTEMIKNIPILCLVTMLDLIGRSNRIADNNSHIKKAFKWLMSAQDAAGKSGGVSEGFHLVHGWLPPYPETTGYIIETFLDYYHVTGDAEFKKRAIRMVDWLVSIQHEDGAIPDSYFKKKMVFDTGQVIFGFVRAYEETGDSHYLKAAVRAGNWLVGVQEQDGTWKRFAVDNIPHTYYSRVAWSLARLYNITEDNQYLDASIKNINWALSRQEDNGWFNDASFNLSNHHRPFTHTIAYTMRGILEVGLYLRKESFIDSVKKSVDNLIQLIDKSGFVCGTYDKDWNGDRSFCCLTGSAQLAIIFFKLAEIFDEKKYFECAKNINKYLKSKQQLLLKKEGLYGGLAGSWPIWGKYIHFNYPNWAAKFFIDALAMEVFHL